MPEYLVAAVRCDCGGRLECRTEPTERGPRWAHVCERCGVRWGLRDGVFCRRDIDPGQQDAEGELLVWFRRLPEALRSEAVSRMRALALSAEGAS